MQKAMNYVAMLSDKIKISISILKGRFKCWYKGF